MASGTISKNIIKISKNVSISAPDSGETYKDTTVSFTEISSTTAIPISIMLRASSSSNLYYNLPYCTSNGSIVCYVFTWNVNNHNMVIRNLGTAWNNYEINVIFLQ